MKGNKPDFHLAMQGAEASNLYNLLLQKLGTDYSADKIKGDFFTDTCHVYSLGFEKDNLSEFKFIQSINFQIIFRW